ncbi:MAG: M50 family metallopeptidase [Oscillospiraceae bacterium]|nr:M50 family metallopeptidase [Oscillospiraceae bacterium]
MKKEKPKFKPQSIIPYAVGAAIGLAAFFIGYNAGAEGTSDGTEILAVAVAAASFVIGLLLHIIIHEAGHLVCGLLSGYKFVSFTVANIMLVKENGRLTVKKFSMAGVGGQCLMSPPEPRDSSFPFVLYNLGGGLMNFLFSAVSVVLFVVLKDVFPFAGEVFLMFAGFGVFFGASNLLPLKLGGVATDGRNIASLRKSGQARRAFWLILTVGARMAQGERCKDLPAEWFEFADDYDFNDSVLANVATMGLGRLIDRHDFDGAKILAERILDKGDKLIELLKNEARCELLFLEIIGEPCQERQEAIDRLYTPELIKYIKASRTQLSKHRLMYAYEKLVAGDEKKVERALGVFNKTCRAYPFSGDRESERELIEIIDRK